MSILDAVLHLLAPRFADLTPHFSMRSVDFDERRRGVMNDRVRNGYFFQRHTSSKNNPPRCCFGADKLYPASRVYHWGFWAMRWVEPGLNLSVACTQSLVGV